MSKDHFFDNLNEEQQKAVAHINGPALVLAGAGSGKTTVLTRRAAWLLDQGASPFEILLVTFTNKAAQEMNQRITQMTHTQLPFVGTFHKLGVRLLRKHSQMIGIDQQFTIYDTTDQQALIKTLISKHTNSGIKLTPNGVLSAISAAKSELISATEYAQSTQSTYTQVLSRIYHEYQTALKNAHAVDFDDLLTHTIALFENYSAILEQYQSQFQFVMVDEYQDTNKAQYQLTKLLSMPQKNVFVVGDFAQSIYSWRGADYRNMLQFKTDFSPVQEYKLEQNYRSHQTILDAATQVISKATSHPILKLWSQHPQGEKITLLICETDTDEAQTVVSHILKERRTRDMNEIAILYRMNAQSRSIEEALVKAGIPYQLIGGTRFYERAEIKDLLAYLRVATNPLDSVNLQRLEKIGKRKLTAFNEWISSRYPDHQALGTQDPTQIIQEILEVTQYTKKFKPDVEEDVQRLENIAELLRVASQFNQVTNFLENVALVQNDTLADVANNPTNQRVTLMSLHAAKGLEFEVIFLIGMNEGTLPHSRSLIDPTQLEEERRLCYVGITRAKEKLYLSCPRVVFVYGSRQYATPSRFIRDIDPGLLDVKDASQANTSRSFNKPQFQSQTSGRKLVVDDSLIEGIVNGDLDIDALIDA